MAAMAWVSPVPDKFDDDLDESRKPLLSRAKKKRRQKEKRGTWICWTQFVIVLLLAAVALLLWFDLHGRSARRISSLSSSSEETRTKSFQVSFVTPATFVSSSRDAPTTNSNDRGVSFVAPATFVSPSRDAPTTVFASINFNPTLLNSTTNSTSFCFRFACLLAVPVGVVVGVVVGVPFCVFCVFPFLLAIFYAERKWAEVAGGVGVREGDDGLVRRPSFKKIMKASCSGGTQREFCLKFWLFGFLWGTVMGVGAWMGCAKICGAGVIEALGFTNGTFDLFN